MNNILLSLFFTVIVFSGCAGITSEKIKEIYVVYDDSYTQFIGKYNPNYEYDTIEEGYELVLKDPPWTSFRRRVYRRPFNRRYWFIGKFLIDGEKNIEFVPVTSSEGFKRENYKEEDITRIKSSTSIADSRVRGVQKYQNRNYYYDVKTEKLLVLTKDHPKYEDYFLFGFADYTPKYLVIKERYGRKLMENGIILPDPNELKDQVVWQDWYNYWGLTDFKIEIP